VERNGVVRVRRVSRIVAKRKNRRPKVTVRRIPLNLRVP